MKKIIDRIIESDTFGGCLFLFIFGGLVFGIWGVLIFLTILQKGFPNRSKMIAIVEYNNG